MNITHRAITVLTVAVEALATACGMAAGSTPTAPAGSTPTAPAAGHARPAAHHPPVIALGAASACRTWHEARF
jgi:hypothetical protein